MTRERTQWEQDNLTRDPPKNFEEMVHAMLKCEQTTGQTVYQHGMSVHEHLSRLVEYLQGSYSPIEGSWRLPKWLDEFRDEILNCIYEEGKRQLYALYHDCGKPFCRTVDKNTGEQRFPNHALVSSYIWACVGGNDIIGHLISEDMVIHTASAEEIAAKLQNGWSKEHSVTLLLTALAEVHANAILFGGIHNPSFKGKAKVVERRGNQILKFWFPKT